MAADGRWCALSLRARAATRRARVQVKYLLVGAGEEQPVDVLIVDDDHDVRQELASLLRDHGHSVGEAANGRDALAMLGHTPPRLLLLDLMMPGINGMDVLGVLRRTGTGIPVVVITAAHRVRPMVDVPVLHKPFKTDQLLEAVREALSPRRPAA